MEKACPVEDKTPVAGVDICQGNKLMLSRTLTKPCKTQWLDHFQRPCLYPIRNTKLEAQV